MALIGFATRAAKEGASLLARAASEVKGAASRAMTPQDLYKKKFTVDAYHGTADDIQEFDPDMRGSLTDASSAKEAFWFTPSPRTPTSYAISAGKRKARLSSQIKQDMGKVKDPKEAENLSQAAKELDKAGPNIIPVKLRISNPKIIEMNFSDYDTPGRPELTKEIKKAKAEGYDAVIFRNFTDVVPHWGHDEVEDEVIQILKDTGRTDIAERLEAGGGYLNGLSPAKVREYSTIVRTLMDQVQKKFEEVTPSEEYTDHIAVWDPTLIRSIFAKFDPEKINSSDIMAGIAGATILPLATIQAMSKGKSSEQNSI